MKKEVAINPPFGPRILDISWAKRGPILGIKEMSGGRQQRENANASRATAGNVAYIANSPLLPLSTKPQPLYNLCLSNISRHTARPMETQNCSRSCGSQGDLQNKLPFKWRRVLGGMKRDNINIMEQTFYTSYIFIYSGRHICCGLCFPLNNF